MSLSTLTIGISAYNEEKNIGRLLDSLLSQVQDNFEVIEYIIISDGSTDSTTQILKSYESDLIKISFYADRKGQNFRQNQIVDNMSPRSTCLLRLEADTLPGGQYFIHDLIQAIPRDRTFSVICCENKIKGKNNFVSQVLCFGYKLKREVFTQAISWPNLYLFTPCLYSSQFLKHFRWELDFHEDSYCFRKALESGLPIIQNPKAFIIFQAVSSFSDYLIQTSKYQKAMEKEDEVTDIYHPKIDYLSAIKSCLSYMFDNPFYFLYYLLLFSIGRIIKVIMPPYHVFWQIYTSSKDLA